MKRRVVVTGSGAFTPFGDLAQSIEAVRGARSALAPVSVFDASTFAESRAGECRGFDPRPWFQMPKALKLADRRTRLAVAAAAVAFANAGLDHDSMDQAGVVIGTSSSDIQAEDCARAVGALADGDARDIDYFAGRVLRKLNPLWLLINLANMASAHVAIQLGARGPNSTITTDWIAGVQAIGEAARWIAGGEADVVIAGGADCGVLPFVYASLEKSGFFNGDAGSFVPGEGAAVFVLEELGHARARGAAIVAEVTGYASSAGSDALARTMRGALGESGSARVDLLCDAALFSTPHLDDEERAVRSVFPVAPKRFECNSLAGNALAAAAPIAMAIATSEFEGQSMLINSLGSLGQAASLAVTTGVPS